MDLTILGATFLIILIAPFIWYGFKIVIQLLPFVIPGFFLAAGFALFHIIF